jgi:uncharacterized protein
MPYRNDRGRGAGYSRAIAFKSSRHWTRNSAEIGPPLISRRPDAFWARRSPMFAKRVPQKSSPQRDKQKGFDMLHTSFSPDAAEALIKLLDLQRHPEGGWYKETWRGAPDIGGTRGIGTAILFLLAAGERSHWHRVDATELWLYHAGAPLRLFTAEPSGAGPAIERRLGPDLAAGDAVQHVIRSNEWQSAEATDGWCLVSCVVVPAFEFSGFELAHPEWEPGATDKASAKA